MSAISVTEQARKQANLRLLQRTVNSNIVDIVQTATHVVLYEYEAATAWQKTGFEGSLFLSHSAASYQLIILNRNSPDNFQMPISADTQLQHDDPFLIFKQKVNGDTRIRGIWFHNADERISMAGVLQKTLQGLVEGRLPGVAAPVVNAWEARAAVAAAPAPVTAAPVAVAAVPVAVAAAPVAAVDSSAALAALLGVASISGQAGAPPPDVPPTLVAQQQQPQTPAAMAAPPGTALDKKSLQLALLSLIQDDRFLDLVHSQYLRVVHARTKKGGNQQ
jgi:mRNA-decapping enzyme 1B